MLIKRDSIKKQLKEYLQKENKDDLIVSSKNRLFDLTVYKLSHDEFYKLVFLNEFHKIEDIKRILRTSIYSSLFVKRYFYIALYDGKSFKFIQI